MRGRSGYAWTWTECVSYGRGEPYRFARLLAQAFADEHGTDSGTFVRQLLFGPGADPASIRRFGGAIAAVARDAAFTGWEAEAADAPDDPAETASALIDLATAYLDRMLTTDGPRVIVVDDVHWVDLSSAQMVEIIVAAAGQRALVVIAMMRPGQPPAWADQPHVAWLQLDGLAPPETAQLATIVARAALDADDARLIHERTEGNPLFIGETVRASIEDGTLELRNGRMTLTEPGPPRLPLTLRAVLGARIDGLDEPARDVVGVASVIGMALRGARCGRPPGSADRPATLDRLVDAALIVPLDAGRWRFSHPLVHDAAYAGILAARRRRLHALLADSLEARPTTTSVATIATHRAASGDAARAIPLLDEAATSALAMGAAAEAAGFWRTAADLATDPAAAARYRDAAGAAMSPPGPDDRARAPAPAARPSRPPPAAARRSGPGRRWRV